RLLCGLLRDLDPPVERRRAAKSLLEVPAHVDLRAAHEGVEEVLRIRVRVAPALGVLAHTAQETVVAHEPLERAQRGRRTPVAVRAVALPIAVEPGRLVDRIRVGIGEIADAIGLARIDALAAEREQRLPAPPIEQARALQGLERDSVRQMPGL